VKSVTCFLIDDDHDDQEIFCSVLEAIGIDNSCIMAPNGQVALDMLNSGSISPHIIFLDLNMPLMNGLQFLREYSGQKISSAIPVVVLTTSGDPATKQKMLELGAKEFITKPEKFSDWQKAVSDAIGRFSK
jgi:CheY-like chemotaxis protein